MTGFIKGLFKGNKGNKVAKSAPAPQPPQQKGNAFFLEPDDAKTFGNIDYMRKTNTIERTFPRGKAQVSQVSSSNFKKINENDYSSSSFNQPQTSFQPSTTKPSFSTSSFKPSSFTPPNRVANVKPTEQRRSEDTGMDMFRKMAKSIKKG